MGSLLTVWATAEIVNMLSANNKYADKKGFRIAGYFKEFCQESTIGGIRHLAEEKNHPVEMLLWLVAILLAVTGTIALIYGSWQRYNDSPIVIAFDKEYRSWKIPIPAFTVCLPDKVDETKAVEYIKEHWPNADDNKTQYYLDFINMAAKLSMKNMLDLQRFVNDTDLSEVDIEDLARKVHPDLEIRTVSPATTLYTYNEHGLCIGVDSVTENALVAGGNTSFMQELKKVDYLTTAYNKIIIINHTKAEFYVYSVYEVVDVSMRPTAVNTEATITYIYLPYISKASEDLRHLSMAQRRCCFHDEMKDSGLPVYSWNLCRMKCRVKLAQELCGCVPHFYKILGTTKFCNLSGLLCVSKFLRTLIKFRDGNGQRVDCYCYPTCNEITISLLGWKKAGLNKRTENVNIGWTQQFPTTMYNRDTLFTFTDLLVSFGSTAGLFLGVSLLSGVELVYFFTIRLLFILTRRDKSEHLAPRRRNRLEILQSFN